MKRAADGTETKIVMTSRALNHAAQATTTEAKTLAELGVPGPLAREMERVFALMGKTRGDQVVGYTFTTPDGQQHALRTSQAPERLDRAA
ncbi:MAG: hypothetical protein QM767_23615 [Anaeromyxobacter sp.]